MGSGASKSGSYKLTYFNGRGRGEMTRLCFAAAGCPFEDMVVLYRDYSGDAHYLHSMLQATCRVVKTTNSSIVWGLTPSLHGTNDLQSAKIDELVDTIQEITMETTSNMFTQDESAKQAKFKTLKETKIPFLFDYVEKTIKENPSGSGYIVGTKLSLADLAVFNSVETMLSVVPTLLDKYPNVKALRTKVEQNANIAKYLAKRNKTPF